jgi:hypothetical protein
MTIQARLETFEDANRRASPRRRLRLGSTLTGAGHEVVIHDLSSTGVLLQTSAKLGAFDNFEIELPEVGATPAFVVWTSSDFYGCEFARPIPRSALSAAQLRNPISEPMAAPARKSGSAEAKARELSFAVRMRIILGASILLWAAILWSVSAIW